MAAGGGAARVAGVVGRAADAFRGEKTDGEALAARLREIAARIETPIDALEPAVRAIVPALDELGRMIESVRRETGTPNGTSTRRAAEPDAPVAVDPPADLDAARVRSLAAALAAARQEGARLEGELASLRARLPN